MQASRGLSHVGKAAMLHDACSNRCSRCDDIYVQPREVRCHLHATSGRQMRVGDSVCRIDRCVDDLRSCQEEANVETCEPPVSIGNYTMSVRRACTFDRIVAFEGMAAWRWILFFLAFWPLLTIAHLVSHVLTSVVNRTLTDGNSTAVYLTVGLHNQVAFVLRAFSWVRFVWFRRLTQHASEDDSHTDSPCFLSLSCALRV